ncbi:MAG: hypothetical protein M1827_007695 [Pycnora praestabilis]|nr:MAG: hypothetical protein M1827_007695 [Pycnora praestabilis]
MPSRSNPNVPTSQKRKANRSKVRKAKSSHLVTHNKIAKTSARGAGSNGMGAPVSKKKAKKLQTKANNVRRREVERAMAETGEIDMRDAPAQTRSKGTAKKYYNEEGVRMDVDEVA